MTESGIIPYLHISQVGKRIIAWKLDNSSLGATLTYLDTEH
jgi:hypothetical protein